MATSPALSRLRGKALGDEDGAMVTVKVLKCKRKASSWVKWRNGGGKLQRNNRLLGGPWGLAEERHRRAEPCCGMPLL
ncbi:hypothetical protein ZHAS_00004115 [Anopheles sinensis]|uniref:Uncharacterized protein n=1 Tax=Anopheles sinensis TaxID=74873 RepID=A0A084VG48_ANOSI|nr:hypothetical protein ZHAS_00004115 [Anopheles sinensis]